MAHTSRTLIGRDAELEELLAALGVTPTGHAGTDRAGADHAGTDRAGAARCHVLLSGDAGVGKTRLLQELAERARTAGWQVHVGHCLDLGESALPYLPFSELLDRLAAELPAVVERVGRSFPDLARLQPVRRLLGATAAPQAGDVDRMQLFEGVRALLEEVATTPLLLVVEDVHWADQSTRDLLTFLLTRATSDRIAIVASYRTDDLHRRHPLRREVAGWSRLQSVSRVAVGPLAEQHVRALVRELDPAAGEPAVQAIIARAEGNAFFVEELVGAASGPDRWVPDELADVLLVRLDRLSETARELVRTASVAGRTVSHALLAAVSELSEDALDEALREAVEAHVLVAGEGSYWFRHALLGEAVYDDLLPGQRVRLHARYVAALCSGQAEGTAAALARHARLAHDLDAALAASIRAGDEAATIGGPAEAAAHFEYVLQLLADPGRALPEGESLVRLAEATVDALLASGHTERAARVAADQVSRVPADDNDARARLLTAQAVSLGLLDHGEVGAVEVSAQAVAASVDCDPALHARVLANHCQILYWHDHNEEAERIGLEALALAERLNLGQVASGLITTLSSAGRMKTSPSAFRAMMPVAIERTVASGNLAAELQARFILARSYEDDAEWPEAEAAFRAVVEVGERTGRPWAPYAFEARHQLAWVLLVSGRWDDALALVRNAPAGAPPLQAACLDAIRLAIRQGRGERVPTRIHRRHWDVDALLVSFSAGTEIRASVTPADALEVYADATEAMARAWGPGYGAVIRLAATTLGRIADVVAAGSGTDPTLAATADRLLDDARRSRRRHAGESWGPEGLAWDARVRAEALRLHWLVCERGPGRGDPADLIELIEAWRAAEEAFARFGHVYELAMVRTVLAGLLQAAGDLEGARVLADQARTAARALGARPLLATLGEGATSSASNGTGAGELTAREAEILALVAEGRSNGEIGKRLFISTKTVSVHVSNILAKLGASSRTEAAAIARRQGLIPGT